MKYCVVLLALFNVVLSGHVAVRMPFLNPAGVTYASYGAPALNYEYSRDQLEHLNQHAQIAAGYSGFEYQAKAPAAIGYAQVPVQAAVAVPTVQHVAAVADVPVTKIHAQHGVIQKVVDVAKPATKTRKYEIRRPAIQKQFYDIEERTIIRPVGSALVELDEPLSKAQKGPAIVTSVDEHHHHHEVAVAAEHGFALKAAPVAVAPAVHTVAITPAPHNFINAHHHHEDFVAITPAPYAPAHDHYHQEKVFVSSTPAPIHYSTPAPIHYSTPAPIHYSTPAPIHYSTPEQLIVSSTPVPHYDDSVVVEAAARNAAAAEYAAYEAKAAHDEAVAHYNARQAHLAVDSYSNGSPLEHYDHQEHHDQHPEQALKQAASLNHLSPEEAQANQQRLIKLLTAKGGVAEVGFGRDGHAEHVGDAGISRARVLSATPSPHHEPVEEKVKTRRIVVSRPVQTLQEIDVVEPVTKLERVAVNQPAVFKTAQVGLERVHTSVPVYGKALAPAIAHAQVPVGYYHK